jgi:D-beta-D-heptose 7-phosphate kinase/D-beta-D-heptose 1-phosphate adenosyltransferase
MNVLKNTQQQAQFKILLIGDDCIDVYQYGTVDRISPEAPVPVFKFNYEERRAGMAGNVYNNLQNLGCNVNYLHGHTSTKTRLVDVRSKQHIVRIDNDVESEPLTFATEIPDIYDAIVISDYNKGTVSYELIQELRQEFSGPIFVDTKKTDLARLEGCIVKINSLENSLLKTTCTNLIVTLGKYGARYNDKTYTADPVEVADVCGAGDTFLAALVSEYLVCGSVDLAIPYAIRAAGITVQHLGVYAPTKEELE